MEENLFFDICLLFQGIVSRVAHFIKILSMKLKSGGDPTIWSMPAFDASFLIVALTTS